MTRAALPSLRMVCLGCRTEYSGNRSICSKDSALLVPLDKDALVGQKLGAHYEVLDLLGYGATSTVYKAKHELMERTAAIKVQAQHLIHDEASLKRLKREVAALTMMNHKNVVTLYDCGFTATEQPYIVLEYLQGSTLEDWIDLRGSLPTNIAIPIFIQICDALEHAHRLGIIHQDLKPGNVVIVGKDNELQVKLVDFGIARFLGWASTAAQSLTPADGSNKIVGTPLYMSPEHVHAGTTDNRSDVYSLGLIMYQAMTGVLPLTGSTLLDIIRAHVKEMPKSFKAVRPDLNIPPLYEAIIFKALQKKPEDRFASMSKLKEALEQVGQERHSVDKEIGVLIVDDVEGMSILIKRMMKGHFTILGEASNGNEALEKVAQMHPQIVIMDIGMPGLDGLSATAKIKEQYPETKVLMITSHDSQADVRKAMTAKADGYLVKQVDEKKLHAAIRTVATGATWLDEGLALRIFESTNS